MQRILDDLRQGALPRIYDYRTEFPPTASIGPARRGILNYDKYVYRGVKMLDLIHASRGCRFNCFPCCTPFLGGRRFRPRPIAKVVEEIETIDNSRLFFVDNSFAQDHDWQVELFKALIPLRRKWVSHPIENDDEVLSLAYDAGCWYVYQAIFDTSDVIRERVRNYKEHGIGVEGTIILGTDEHDEDYIKRLVDFLLEIELDIAEFTILTPFPHSAIRETLAAENRIVSDNWADYTCDRVVFQPKRMSRTSLQDIYYYAWETFYSSMGKEMRMGELFRKVLLRERRDGTFKRSAAPLGRQGIRQEQETE